MLYIVDIRTGIINLSDSTRYKMFSRLILSALILFGAISSSECQESGTMAIQWKGWEFPLTSSLDSENIVQFVEVEFNGPGGISFRTPAFTDDGVNYKIRASFPVTGSWRWRSQSSNHSDDGLHHIRGRVEVIRYDGNNILYKHGDLKSSEDGRYLVHADNTPFLWIGDTGWNIIRKSSMEEWKYYIGHRVSQGFTVIQVSPRGTGNRNYSADDPDISFNADGTSDTVFWNDLEEKIRYANDKGMMILLAGVGNAWRDKMALNPSNQDFVSYLTGRMASFMVIFAPSLEQMFADELDKVAAGFRKYSQHLVTQYPGPDHSSNLTYRNTSSVDFSGLNSGHHDGNNSQSYYAARQWTLDLWTGAPVKPVINLRSVYDAYGNDSAGSWREMDSRKTGWITLLSGAAGVTYGCGDFPPGVPGGHGAVWGFNQDSTSYDYWKNAINWQSSSQMSYIREFFSSIEWWSLIPSHEIIRNQETTDTLKMVAGRSYDLNMIVAYLPANPRIVIDMSQYLGSYRYTWFNPKTGLYLPPVRFNGGDPNQLFIKPEDWDDAALKITRLNPSGGFI